MTDNMAGSRIFGGWLALAAAMLLGIGAASAAIACPATIAVSSYTSQAPANDCDHSALDACTTSCGTMCQALVPDRPDPATASADMLVIPPPFESLEGSRRGPEPPPPRTE
jgi:hypothetical protein